MAQTFILGIDGLPCWMWRQFADQGVMPYSASLLDTGRLLPMQSAVPEVSSAAWASIVTGENPGAHNVFGFTDLIDGTYTLGFTSSRTFKAAPFWQRNDGRRNLIINVPQSYPAAPLNGTLAAGFVALDLERAVYPPEDLPLLEQFGYRVDADMTVVEQSKQAFVDDLEQVLDARYQAFDHLWRREIWDTAMFVITGTDRLNHYLWEDYEDAASPLHQRFLDFYRKVDDVVQRVVSRLPDDVILAAVSDHGFGAQRMTVNVNRILLDHGYLQLNKSDRPSFADLQPETKAFAMDPGRIYIHRSGKYPQGSVDDEETRQLEEELIRLFSGFEVNGKPIVDSVPRGRDVYSGPYAHRGPDLVLMAADGVALSGRLQTADLLESTLINGKHTFEEATFFLRGCGSAKLPQPMKVEHVLGVLNEAAGMKAAA